MAIEFSILSAVAIVFLNLFRKFKSDFTDEVHIWEFSFFWDVKSWKLWNGWDWGIGWGSWSPYVTWVGWL